MSPVDPLPAAQDAKRTEALLREARSVLRRLDKLAGAAAGSEPATRRLVLEVREAAERLVSDLARQERIQQQAVEAGRRGR